MKRFSIFTAGASQTGKIDWFETSGIHGLGEIKPVYAYYEMVCKVLIGLDSLGAIPRFTVTPFSRWY